jgi:hypothetical protein
VKAAVRDWLRNHPQNFLFSNGIKKLAERWAKCIEAVLRI